MSTTPLTTSGLPSPEWSAFRAFLTERTTEGQVFVVSLRLLWRAYRDFCQEGGFYEVNASTFVQWLDDEEYILIKQGGRGRSRRMACGLALVPEDIT